MNSARHSSRSAASDQTTWFYLILFSFAACLFTLQLEATNSSFSTPQLNSALQRETLTEEAVQHFTTYPNPASTSVTISSTEPIEFKPRMVVFNTNGGEYEVNVKALDNAIQLDLSEIPQGRYIIKPGIGFARFIKE